MVFLNIAALIQQPGPRIGIVAGVSSPWRRAANLIDVIGPGARFIAKALR